MCLMIPLSEKVEAALRRQAEEAGMAAEVLAARLVEGALARVEELRAITAPVHEAFKASGMTEDEAVELFEAEKHAMRRERRNLSP